MDLLSNRSEGNPRACPRSGPGRGWMGRPDPTDTAGMSPRLVTLATCLGAFLLTLFVVSSWTIPGEGNRFAAALWVLAREGGVAAVWWVAAAGFGLAIVRLSVRPAVQAIGGAAAAPRTSLDQLVLAVAAGAAAMLAIASALGSLGLLTAAGGIANWLVAGAGVFLLVRILRDSPVEPLRMAEGRWNSLVAPALASLLFGLYVAAAASAPGWLWSSEFGGFDALSYHLELPKEWLIGGKAVGPVEGNVYSALPSFVEAAFMQLMLMRARVVEGAFACQFWALFAAVATAAAVARLARCVVGGDGAPTAFLLVLSLPWLLVTGTLAYNDVVPCLMLAAAWLFVESTLRDGRALEARGAACLALLAAAAVGAKPTAFLFVALPLLAVVVMRLGPRTLRLAPLVVAVALAVLSPWLVRNQLAYGNPLFPFAHTLLGDGPWTEEQFALFAKGHGPGIAFLDRIPLVVSQWLAHGIGTAPGENEPWFPQWGLLPVAGLAGLAFEQRRSAAARAALVAIAVSLLCWLLATHLKSRFLLPTAVPLALGATMLLARVARAAQPAAVPLLLAPIIALPLVVYWREPAKPLAVADGGEPQSLRAPAVFIGDTTFMPGDRLALELERATAEGRAQLAQQASVAFFINHRLPPEARVLAVGHSTPFYLRRHISWNTVWDRGALDRVAEESAGTPQVWGAKLRALGYTHVIINPAMLVVWTRSGWINPLLEPKRWLTAFLQANPHVRTSEGCFIVDLTAAAAAPGTEAAPALPEGRPPSAS